MSAPALQLSAMLLGKPDENSLPTLRQLAAEQRWLQPAVDELLYLPLEQWQAEHTRLFINGYPKTPCAPFESIYRHGRMEGPACDELARLYANAGVSASDDLPADYLGTMLEFAALLIEQGTPEADLLLKTLQDKHLLGWLPQFNRRLLQEARLNLYRSLGERLQKWISA
jgi:putative dimethyl sulfoxide reductase chaperone